MAHVDASLRGILSATTPTASGNNDTDSSTVRARYSWVIAVLLCVLAAAISNFGTNLQKLAWTKSSAQQPGKSQKAGSPRSGSGSRSRRNSLDLTGIYADLETSREDEPAPLSRAERNRRFRRYWVPGLLLVVSGAVCDFTALGFGAQSVVAPLGSLTLVMNMGFAQLLHGEVLTKKDMIATGFIIVGCVFAVAFASHKNEIQDVDTLLGLYKKSRFAVYAFVITAILVFGYLYTNHMERILLVYGSTSSRYKKLFKYHRVSYSSLSGIVGAQTVMFAKTLVEMLASSIAGSRFFLFYLGTYAILAAVAVTIALQIYWLNCALARWDALYVIPVFQSQWMIFTVISGGVFYGEFKELNTAQASAFLFGIVLIVLGVYYLSENDVADPNKQTVLSLSPKSSRSSFSGIGSAGSDAGSDGGESMGEALDSPLIAGSPKNSFSYGEAQHSFEYEQTFEDKNVGLNVRRCEIAEDSKFLFTKDPSRQIEVLQVVGIKDSIEAPKVAVGDIIVAVNGNPTLANNLSSLEVLELIKTSPRPITLRFRRMDMVETEGEEGKSLHYALSKQGIEEAERTLAGRTLNPLLIVHNVKHSRSTLNQLSPLSSRSENAPRQL